MRKLLSNGLVLVAGLMGVPSNARPEVQVTESKYQHDPRFNRLQEFFRAHGAPAINLAEDFLIAADRNQLDWRLLPSICWVESGCGKRYVKNNMFGWDSARTGFPSLRASIHKIAERLANSRLYRNKGLHSVLATYNSNPEYPGLVKRYMRKVGPEEPAPTGNAAYSRNRIP